MASVYQSIVLYCKRARGAKKVASEFFLAHADDVAFMTLEDIAQQTGVSMSTICRTAAEIGYKGYPELQDALRKRIRQGLAPVERLRRANLPEGSWGYKESIAMDEQNIGGLLSLNSPSAVERAISMLVEAPVVCTLATRSSYGVLSCFNLLLSQIRPGVRMLCETEGRMTESLLDLHERDVVLAVSMPRYASVVLEAMSEAAEQKCRIISISDGPSSPLAALSEVALFSPLNSYSFFNSTAATLVLLNALLTGVNVGLGDAAKKRLQKHGELLKRWKVTANIQN